MVYNDIHLSNRWFKSVIRVYVVFIVFASLGLRPWDVNTIKTSIHPYNQHMNIRLGQSMPIPNAMVDITILSLEDLAKLCIIFSLTAKSVLVKNMHAT